MRSFYVAAFVGLTACASIPQLDGTIDAAARGAPFPDLINIDGLTANTQQNTQAPPDLAARIARLNAKAAELRGPITQ